MAKSVKKNYVLSLINSGTQLLFPLIAFPYVSRIMAAEGIGQVNFYGSIIQYIILFCGLGIPVYGIREVARVRSDRMALQQTTIELLTLHSLLTIIGYAIVGVLCLTVGEIQENIPLFLVISMSLFFSTIGCEWFYQGIEDFEYIMVRGICVKTLMLVFLFTLIHTREQILLYGLYTVLGALGGNIFNFFRLRKYISLSQIRWKELSILPHLKAALTVFVFTLITSFYLQFSSVLLGFMREAEDVGYYTVGIKIVKMVMMVASAFGTVMLPRISHLVASQRLDEFRSLSSRAFEFMFFLTLPMSVGLFFESPFLVHILCGPGFEPAIPVSIITSFMVFVVGMSNVFGMQIFYPVGRIGLVNVCTGIGAGIGVVLNVLLIPSLGATGAAIATLSAEVAVTLSMLIFGWKIIPFQITWKKVSDYVIASILMAAVLIIIKNWVHQSDVVMAIVLMLSGVAVYWVSLRILHNGVCREITEEALSYLKRKKNG